MAETLRKLVVALLPELKRSKALRADIDEMDMLGFLRLRAWDATREQEKKKPRHAFIDEV